MSINYKEKLQLEAVDQEREMNELYNMAIFPQIKIGHRFSFR